MQADGARRFKYNPRILDVVSQIPRGTIYDRQGLPLATDEPASWPSARQPTKARALAGRGVSRSRPSGAIRLAGRAFHLLGDVRTRVNWTASNTSYVERDAADRLRGFDDHAELKTTDVAGRATG